MRHRILNWINWEDHEQTHIFHVSLGRKSKPRWLDTNIDDDDDDDDDDATGDDDNDYQAKRLHQQQIN